MRIDHHIFWILDDDQELKYCHSHDLRRRIDSIRCEFKDFQCARWLVTSCLSRSNRTLIQKGPTVSAHRAQRPVKLLNFMDDHFVVLAKKPQLFHENFGPA